jgi:capsular exopolysaccharide synthesis family protein
MSMTLSEVLATLRAGWKLIAVSLILVTGSAVYYTRHQVPEYQATARLYIAAQVNSLSPDAAYTGGLLSQQRVVSYAAIVASDPVVSQVVDNDGTNRSVDSVESHIAVSTPPNSALLDIAYSDPDPVLAQSTATAVAQAFADFATKLEVLGSSTPPVRVSIVQPAKLPKAPVSPRPKRDIALGVLVGLALGVMAASLRKGLDRTVRTIEDVQRLALPALGSIPEDRSARRKPVLVGTDIQAPRAEAFRHVRTNLLFLNIDDPVHSLVITSPTAQEGKSTTVANLGLTFAQAGLSVVLVEADLRRPELANMLGLEGVVGLTDVLIGATPLDDALQSWHDGLMWVLPSGSLPLNPSELLNSQRAADLVQELENRFDIVLIDTPPVLPVTDAIVISAACSATALVVRSGRSRRDQVRAAATALHAVNARISGVILNRRPVRARDTYATYYGTEQQERLKATSGA